MKRIAMMLMAAFFVGGVMMAQPGRRGEGKMQDPKAHAERMTERMAKEYGLDDAQKAKLLEVNMAWAEKMGSMRPPHGMKRPAPEKACCDSCTCAKEKKGGKEAKRQPKADKRPQLTDEQRAQMKAEREKRQTDMQAARQEYDAQLQQIMTKEQYAAYTKKMQERKEKAGKRPDRGERE